MRHSSSTPRLQSPVDAPLLRAGATGATGSSIDSPARFREGHWPSSEVPIASTAYLDDASVEPTISASGTTSRRTSPPTVPDRARC